VVERPATPRNAGVHVPPPLVYAIAFLAGYGLDRRNRLPIASPGGGAHALAVAGWVLAALGVSIAGSAIVQFVRARTTVLPHRPARALVMTGIYRITRNPMYLSLAVLYVGLALLINSVWPLVLLPVALVIIDRAIIVREERYLSAAFPATYAEYLRRVRRWL